MREFNMKNKGMLETDLPRQIKKQLKLYENLNEHSNYTIECMASWFWFYIGLQIESVKNENIIPEL